MFFQIFGILLLTITVQCEETDVGLQMHTSFRECVGDIDNIEYMTKELYFFGYRNFPENNEELQEYHRRGMFLLSELRKHFGKCLPKGNVQQFVEKTLNMTETEIKTLSETSSGSISWKQRFFMSGSKCLNRFVFDVNYCINSGINYVLDTFHMNNHSKKEYICCNIPTMNECLSETIMKRGSRYCSTHGLDMAIKYINSFRGDPIQVFCKDFIKDNIEERCHDLEVTAPPNFDLPEPKYFYYFVPLIESLLRH